MKFLVIVFAFQIRFFKSCFLSDLIRNINDPEHPLTLEELHVLEESRVFVDNEKSEVFVNFTPTIPVSVLAIIEVSNLIHSHY